MFRSNWDFVTPSSWLGSLAGEEALMSGLDLDNDDLVFPTTILLIPELPDMPATAERERESADEGDGIKQSTARAAAAVAGTSKERGEEDTAMGSGENDTNDVDDDFFADLPPGTRALETKMPTDLLPPVAKKTKDGYAYFTYSYSRCATLSDSLELVSSTRRRYEDSGGRLKAVHKRRIGDRMIESTWKKRSGEDTEGSHDVRVSAPGDSKQQFDQDWVDTPFGRAQARAKAHGQAQQTIYPDEPPAAEIP